MTFIKSHLILATLFTVLIAMTLAMSAANAGSVRGGGFMDVSGLDLGSGR